MAECNDKAAIRLPRQPAADSRTAESAWTQPFRTRRDCLRAGLAGALASTGCANASSARAPLYRDPHYHGSCDPEIVWNPAAREWWIFYTARRANRASASYVGTPIGVAASKDWRDWRFLGYLSFDGEKGRPDMPVTFWAPGILRAGEHFHLFVTYKDNATPPWGGSGWIVHYEAPAGDLLDGWKNAGPLPIEGPEPIDATLAEVDGEYRIWYRVNEGGGIQWSVSRDLISWESRGKAPGDLNRAEARDFGYQEAPYVFRWRGRFWMLTDPHRGLAVYRSGDAITWNYSGRILIDPGSRSHDSTRARHPSVAIVEDRAFVFYHVEPWRRYENGLGPEERTPQEKRSFLQIAELRLDGDTLGCDRDAPVVLPEGVWQGPVA